MFTCETIHTYYTFLYLKFVTDLHILKVYSNKNNLLLSNYEMSIEGVH